MFPNIRFRGSFFVKKRLITIQSHISLIILVMMRINYQLNSWSPQICGGSALHHGMLLTAGWSKYTSHFAQTQTGSVMFFNRWTEYGCKCRVLHERQETTGAKTKMYITASSVQQRKNLEVIVFVGASISNGFISSIWIIASCFGLV